MTDTASLIDSCGIRFRDPTFQVRTRPHWLTYINKAYGDFVKRARFPMPQLQTDIVFPAHVNSQPLPAEAWEVYSAFSMTDKVPLTAIYARDQQLDLYPPTGSEGVVAAFTIEQNNLIVFPTPNAPTTVRVLAPSPLTDLTDSGSSIPVIPTQYQNNLADGALALAFRDDQNAELAQVYQKDFDDAIQDCLADLGRPKLGQNVPMRADYFRGRTRTRAGWR